MSRNWTFAREERPIGRAHSQMLFFVNMKSKNILLLAAAILWLPMTGWADTSDSPPAVFENCPDGRECSLNDADRQLIKDYLGKMECTSDGKTEIRHILNAQVCMMEDVSCKLGRPTKKYGDGHVRFMGNSCDTQKFGGHCPKNPADCIKESYYNRTFGRGTTQPTFYQKSEPGGTQ